MAFAINITTESCDNYLVVIDGKPNLEAIIEAIEDELGGEIDYISGWNIAATYELSSYFHNELNKKLNSFGN